VTLLNPKVAPQRSSPSSDTLVEGQFGGGFLGPVTPGADLHPSVLPR
jgi:hypothetical protein